MDKVQASNIVKNTFEKPFDKSAFIGFVKNLLNQIEDAPFIYKGNYIHDSFKEYITSLERIGKYSDGEHKIDILIVQLKKETSIERARTMQRNYIAKYLNGNRGGEMKDAALVAFVSPNTGDWRFSLVKMDYKFEKNAKGKTKVKEEFTPARRWSFLVGTHENSHTAQSRLVPLISEDMHKPTLAELEESFNIEKVTKEFFEKYRELFLRTKDKLDEVTKNDSVIRTDFENKGVNTVDFSKKLLGQIVFLYFLQKKGWFGVQRDSEWGTGSKQFLRELFEKKHGVYNNFFNDILEPLFYEALRIDRSHDDHYYSRFNCKIPFLNGGLFDPMNGYDWVKTDILIPNELFSNTKKTKAGDTGDGILDIFDRYNFTVKEDEPLEKEVAIDPELLGKAYEKFNAIRPDNYSEFKKALKSGKNGDESKFNKQYGVYYTPREIVHYMCQQSLINYLFTELNDSTATYEKLGHEQTEMSGNETTTGQPDFTIEHHAKPTITKKDIEILVHFGEHVSENEAYIEKLGKETDTYKNKLPESIRKNADVIDRKLADIKVCDPAVGSGAFPVGMMSEIVRARNVLRNYLTTKDTKEKQGKSIYDFKRKCIENSLYGVDIDSGAVEIAKLRLWLSLVVDEDDIQNIKPLPNLDYKIVAGNSLIGVEKNLFNVNLFTEVEALKPLYFNATNIAQKKETKAKIDGLIDQITNGRAQFDFEIYFSEVFHEQGGFDVVIGNPPYVQLQKEGGRLAKMFEKAGYNTFERTGDIYSLFYEKGWQLLKSKGALCFITSNKWMRAGYGESTRKFFAENTNPILLIDFAGQKIFEAATVDVNILMFSKDKNQQKTLACIGKEDVLNNLSVFVRQQATECDFFTKKSWTILSPIEQSIKKKIEKIGTPLKNWDINIYRGILTGYNEAFIIDESTKDKLIKEDAKSAEIIRPILRGRDIKRYRYEFADLYLITTFPSLKIDIEKYPAIKKHLLSFGMKRLEQTGREYKVNGETIKARKKTTNKWFETQDSISYWDDFNRQKIVWAELARTGNAFTYDDAGYLVGNTGYILVMNKESEKKIGYEYLLSFLNSKAMLFYLDIISTRLDETGWRWLRQYVELLPIPLISIEKQSVIRVIVRNELKRKTKTGQSEIDYFVNNLYNFTEEEIDFLQNFIDFQ